MAAINMRSMAPGIALSLAVGVAATALNRAFPTVSAMLVAIILGIVWCNVRQPAASLRPGIGFSAKHLLRVGIVLLGLQLVVGDIIKIGWGALLMVVLCVGLTFLVATLVGRALKLPTPLTLLIASGFSICGAAAVAGARSVTRADEEETATSLALVVLFGTLMIPFMPLLAHGIGFGPEDSGILIGLSTHEVAQVVAAAGIMGEETLSTAVTVKLGRVLMLAPVMVGLALWQRKTIQSSGTSASLPPLVPGFVMGFIVCVALRSVGWVPESLLLPAQLVQNLLMAAAMFALGMGVRLADLVKVGMRPVLLALVATAFIVTLAATGVALL